MAEKVKSQNQYLALLGSMIVGIVCGATEGISPILQKVSDDLDLSVVESAILSGCGVVGLFFIIPSGIILDRYGTVNGTIIGYFIGITGYISFSFCTKETFWLMCLTFLMSSFGNGLSWFSALKVSIDTLPQNPGVGLAFASACMSASVGLVNTLLAVYQGLTSHDENNRWPELFRVMAIIHSFCVLPGYALLRTFKETPEPFVKIVSYDDLTHEESDDEEDEEKEENQFCDEIIRVGEDGPLIQKREDSHSEIESADSRSSNRSKKEGKYLGKVRLDDFNFWLICFSFCLGIGAGILVLSALNEMWHSFTGGDVDDDKWPNVLSAMFAVCNVFIGTLFAGSLADYIVLKHGWRRSLPTALCSLFSFIVFSVLFVMAMFQEQWGDQLAFQILWMIFLSLVGASFGATLTLYPVLLTDLYGMIKFNAYWSFIETVSCIPAFGFPYATKGLYDYSGDFSYLFMSMQVCFLISSVLLFRIK